MDKNTTTGLILIGAVVIAFMYLNKPQEPQKTEQVVTSKSKSKENSEMEIDEPVTENKSEISNIETLDSNDLVIYQKLKEQKKKEDLIERYGVFFTSAEGTEEILEIQNKKLNYPFLPEAEELQVLQWLKLIIMVLTNIKHTIIL